MQTHITANVQYRRTMYIGIRVAALSAALHRALVLLVWNFYNGYQPVYESGFFTRFAVHEPCSSFTVTLQKNGLYFYQ